MAALSLDLTQAWLQKIKIAALPRNDSDGCFLRLFNHNRDAILHLPQSNSHVPWMAMGDTDTVK